ncbi:MAG: acyltransferase [Actinomycetota bacterium]|nr:acyltransferase [Actinomycetota bacterium]
MTRRDAQNFAALTSPTGVRHQPGLDGIRGLGVAAVVVFHSGLGVLPGGYLGVSLFFTLSGVVIGTVILQEIGSTGGLSLRDFWTRRARRLLPAAWIVLAVVALARPLADSLASTSRGDVAASWLHVANWHFLAEETSYHNLFEGPSALIHFWSLAIEEQFYFAVGVLAVAVAAVSRRPANLLGVVAALGAIVSFALPFVFGFGVDRTYYGTDTRGGELLVGLVIAAVISSAQWRRRVLEHGRPVAAAGLVALVLTVTLWASLPAASPSLRMGMLPLVALASCALALAALVPRGLVWQIATLPPVRELGRISYGLYLIHWPLFVLTERAVPSAPLRALVVIPASIVLAELSMNLVEMPVRRRVVQTVPTMAAATVVAVVIVAALIVPARRSDAEQFLGDLERARPLVLTTTSTSTSVVTPTTATDVDTGDGEQVTGGEFDAGPTGPALDRPTGTASRSTTAADPPAGNARSGPTTVGTEELIEGAPLPATTPTPTPTTLAPRPVVALFGDSVALSLALALPLAAGQAGFQQQAGVTEIGCGAALAAPSASGAPAACVDADGRAAAAVQANAVDVAVVMSCQWELLAQQIPGDSIARAPGDPVFDEYVRAAYEAEVTNLRIAGADRVLWIRCPHFATTVGVAGLDPRFLASRDPMRVDWINQIVDGIAAARDDVDVVDLASWVEPRREDATVRPDGSHYAYEVDTGVAAALTGLINELI